MLRSCKGSRKWGKGLFGNNFRKAATNMRCFAGSAQLCTGAQASVATKMPYIQKPVL